MTVEITKRFMATLSKFVLISFWESGVIIALNDLRARGLACRLLLRAVGTE